MPASPSPIPLPSPGEASSEKTLPDASPEPEPSPQSFETKSLTRSKLIIRHLRPRMPHPPPPAGHAARRCRAHASPAPSSASPPAPTADSTSFRQPTIAYSRSTPPAPLPSLPKAEIQLTRETADPPSARACRPPASPRKPPRHPLWLALLCRSPDANTVGGVSVTARRQAAIARAW